MRTSSNGAGGTGVTTGPACRDAERGRGASRLLRSVREARLDLLRQVLHHADHGDERDLAEAADARLREHFVQRREQRQVVAAALAVEDAVEEERRLLAADAARHALSARLVAEELHHGRRVAQHLAALDGA